MVRVKRGERMAVRRIDQEEKMKRQEMEAVVAQEIHKGLSTGMGRRDVLPYGDEVLEGETSFEVKFRGVDYLVTVTRKDGQ